MAPRARDRIIENLENIYRNAYERAKAAGDEMRMMDLDASFQREQLLLEVLMDLRDAIYALGEPPEKSTLDKLKTIKNIAKLR